MDAFYASCELLRHPELKGKPFVVGTSDEANKMRGVVETCSYEAKKLGIHSAMPVMLAYRIKKDIAYVPSDHAYYEETSARVMKVLQDYKFKMEVLSVDEAAIDTGGMGYDDAEALARKIKKEIRDGIGIPCTIGISTGKILAKMVCDSAKPDGLKIVKGDEVVDFLREKPVDNIPGVGKKTAERLGGMGIKTIGDLANANSSALASKIGSFGLELASVANGVDNSVVVGEWKVLSIGRERTLEHATSDLGDVNKMLDGLAEEVWKEISSRELQFKTVTVKAKYSDFSERIKGKTLHSYSDSLDLIRSVSHALIAELRGKREFRKVGVRVSSFSVGKAQKRLF